MEKIKGHILDFDAAPPRGVSWRFCPKGRGKVSRPDMVRELFDQGMSGNFYVSLFYVPEEYPAEMDSCVDLYEIEDACRILADLCHYRLTDGNGREI